MSLPSRLDIKGHSKEMALLGEKSALLDVQNSVQKRLIRVNKKLQDIEHKRTVNLLKESGTNANTK